MTQRLARSSRTPELKFPPAKNDTPARAAHTIVSAISAGWAKKAANPPHPRTARPRYAAVPTTMSANLTGKINIVHPTPLAVGQIYAACVNLSALAARLSQHMVYAHAERTHGTLLTPVVAHRGVPSRCSAARSRAARVHDVTRGLCVARS